MSQPVIKQNTEAPASRSSDAGQITVPLGEGGRKVSYLVSQPAAESDAALAVLPRPLQIIEKPPRKAWLDYLRVFAILAVITGHVVVDFYRRFGEIGQAE